MQSPGATQGDVPAESALLCSKCGYTLDGLPSDGRCPECGTAISETTGVRRVPPAWETVGGLKGWLFTTLGLLRRPIGYWASFQSRPTDAAQYRRAQRFAAWHAALAGLLFAVAITYHARLIGIRFGNGIWLPLLAFVVVIVTALGGKWLASHLTAFESRQRGLRLPQPVVWRVLAYQSAALLPFALLAAATVGGARLLVEYQPIVFAKNLHVYIGILAAEAIVGGAYLFWTYWMAMRGVMYAND